MAAGGSPQNEARLGPPGVKKWGHPYGGNQKGLINQIRGVSKTLPPVLIVTQACQAIRLLYYVIEELSHFRAIFTFSLTRGLKINFREKTLK